jgi:hypothetical protein
MLLITNLLSHAYAGDVLLSAVLILSLLIAVQGAALAILNVVAD